MRRNEPTNHIMKSLAFWVAVITAAAGQGIAQTRLDLRTQTKAVDFSGAANTKPVKTGTDLPSSCTAGELFFNTSQTAMGLYACEPGNVWAPAGLPAATVNTGQVLGTNGTAATWQSLGGDISGMPGTVAVQGLQGYPVSAAAPGTGQVLSWSGTDWAPATIASTPNYAKTFTSITALTILGTEHNLGTANLIVSCWNGLTPSSWIEPDAIQVDPVTFNVQVTFSAAQTGRCVVNGSGGQGTGGGGAGGAVASVFGRAGAVSAQTGDYSFSQISGTAGVSQMPAAIPAANIGGGAVSNAAFGTLANVTSDIQAQLNGKAAAAHTHTGGGDLSGDISSAAVVGIQRFPVSSLTPQSGQSLVFNGATGQWQPQTVSGGGGGGAAATAQLTDLNVVYTSPTVLTIGSNCTTTAPCNLRFGTTVISILSSATVTVSGPGSGTAYFYVTSDGTVNAASHCALPLSCSATCLASTNVPNFPLNSIPIANWTVLNGQWTTGGGTDRRAFQSINVINGGAGIAMVDNGTQTTLSVDPNLVPTFLTATANLTFASIANASCSADQTITLAGATPGDSIAPGWPQLPAGVIGTAWVSAANTASVRLCNLSGAVQNPGTVTIRVTDVRGF